METSVPEAELALGACIAKRLTLSRSEPGPHSAFSLEPREFNAMVDARMSAPGHGLYIRHLAEILGRRTACDIERTPLIWGLVERQ